MTHVRTAPCRLHFGLFHVPVEGLTEWPDGRDLLQFGGLGMMVRDPCVRCRFEESDEWSFAGSLAERAAEFAKLVPRSRPYRIVADGPPEHVGLGVGTALGLTIIGYLLAHSGGLVWSEPRTHHDLIAHAARRGKRSGIGVHGNKCGGFIVDDGKIVCPEFTSDSEIRERIDVPDDWRVVLVRPPTVGQLWHGDAERGAFRRARSPDAALDTTTRLLRLANESIIPAIKRKDFETFAANLTDFNRIAGEPFQDDQGGPFADPAVAGVIDELIAWGVLGVGQSSWGPTVFAFASNPDDARRLADRIRDRFPNLADVRVTAADNSGARISSHE